MANNRKVFFQKKQHFGQSLVFLLLLTPFILRGQIKIKGEDQTKAVPLERIMKLSPSALFDPFGSTFAASLEHQIHNARRWRSFEHEFGYTPRITGLSSAASGYRLRSGIRQYWKNKCQVTGNYYFSLAAMHRQFFDHGTEFLWRADRGYQQNLSYRMAISQQFALFNFGVTRYLGYKNKFNLDMSVGLGMRRSHLAFKDLPDDALTPIVPDIYERNFKEYVGATTDKTRTHLFFSSAVAVKLGYVLQKNPLMGKKK
jgi:hypothetical protein